MNPKIVDLEEIKLVGISASMSFSNNKTHELWKQFMQLRHTIQHTSGTDLFSVQLYSESFFDNFNPNAPFKKWAAVAVGSFDHIPEKMERLTMGGLYAVFDYKGNPNEAETIYSAIFLEWLPKTAYTLDNRQHFEILGNNYKNNDSDSEEQICIPIRLK